MRTITVLEANMFAVCPGVGRKFIQMYYTLNI
jgi:hypothetical protein